MMKRSPGPEWVTFQEPAPSSTTSEDELENTSQHGEEVPPILKRKGGASTPLPPPKRPRPSQASDSRKDKTRHPSQSFAPESQSSGRPNAKTSKGGSHATPDESKPRASLLTARLKDSDLSSPGTAKPSLPKIRTPGVSAAKMQVVQRKSKGKEREEMDYSAASPPASPSPPPKRPQRMSTSFAKAQNGTKFAAGVPKDGLRQTSNHANTLVKSIASNKLKPRPSNSNADVIEISSDDGDQPPTMKKPAVKAARLSSSLPAIALNAASRSDGPFTSPQDPPSSVRIGKRPIVQPRRSLPTPRAQAETEVIEISDDSDVPSVSIINRSLPPQASQSKPHPLPKRTSSQMKPNMTKTPASSTEREKREVSSIRPSDYVSSASATTVRYVAARTSVTHSQALPSRSNNASDRVASTQGSGSIARQVAADDDRIVDKVPIPSSSSGSNKVLESFQNYAADPAPRPSQLSAPRPLPPVKRVSQVHSGVTTTQPTPEAPLLLPKEAASKPSLPSRQPHASVSTLRAPQGASPRASNVTPVAQLKSSVRLAKAEQSTPSRPPLPHARRSSGIDLSGLKDVLDTASLEPAGPSGSTALPPKAKALPPGESLALVIMEAGKANTSRPDPVYRRGSTMQDAIDLTGDDSDEVSGLDEAVASSDFLKSLLSAGKLTSQESMKTGRASHPPAEQSRAETHELALKLRRSSLATPPVPEHRHPSPKSVPSLPDARPLATPHSSFPLGSPRIPLPGRTPKDLPKLDNAGPSSQSAGSGFKKPLPLPSPSPAKHRLTLTEPELPSLPHQKEAPSAKVQTITKSGITSSSSEGSSSAPDSTPDPPSAFVVRLAHRSARKSGKTARKSHPLISPPSTPPSTAEPRLPLSPTVRPSLPTRVTASAAELTAPSHCPRDFAEAPVHATNQDIEQPSVSMGNVVQGPLPSGSTKPIEPPASSGKGDGKATNVDVSMGERDDSDDGYILEYINEPAPLPITGADSDSEMDVENMLTTSAPESRASPIPEVDVEQIPEFLPRATPVSATSSTPDPLGGDIPSATDLIGHPRHSTRSSRSASDEPLNFFPEDEAVDTPVESLAPTPSPPPADDSFPVSVRTFGGFPSLNWKTYRQNLDNFKRKCYFSEDLPHSLQDTINRWSEAARRHPSLVHVLQSAIQENTADDEPDAPLIDIINDVDDDPTPPWEFHYTNKMWHSKGVPPPDVTKLTSCNCMGKCDPKSKTCACLKRQQRYTGDVIPDFAYDNRGRLKTSDYPIFECNDLCGCGDECRNRVVQHGRKCAVSIQKTEEKGWGVFAGPKKIYKGSFLGIYAGELLTDSEGEERGFKYNKFGRTYLFDLDFHHLKEGDKNWEVKYTVDAYHAGNFTRFLNHSCDPNCQLVPCYINESDIQKPLLTAFARRDIEAFEEICFSYYGDREGEDDEPEDDEGRLSSSPSENGKVNEGAVYAKCACKAKNCRGFMFK